MYRLQTIFEKTLNLVKYSTKHDGESIYRSIISEDCSLVEKT